MTLFLCFVSLFVGCAIGLLITSMLAAGAREDQCRRCTAATTKALGDVPYGGTDD